MKKRFVSLLAAAVMASIALTGCTGSGDSAGGVDSDCNYIYEKVNATWDKIVAGGYQAFTPEWNKEYRLTFGGIWPMLSTPDLKSTIRELADGDGNNFEDEPSWTAVQAICG